MSAVPTSLWIQFLVLYWANLILDFPLQGDFLGQWKSKSVYLMWVHCFIWGFGIAITLILLGRTVGVGTLVFLIGVHGLIDTWKARKWYTKDKSAEFNLLVLDFKSFPQLTDMQALLVDQFLHIVQLVLVLCVFTT